MPSYAIIMPAAGQSSRFRDKHYKKPFAMMAGRAVWLHSAEQLLKHDDVKQFLLVLSPEDREDFQTKFAADVAFMGVEVVDGGAERVESVANGLARVKDDIDYVVIHDAARPCLAAKWINDVFKVAEKTGAAILGTPITSTLKRVNDSGQIAETVSREQLWAAQTPQVFRRELLIEAMAKRSEVTATDEACLVENIGHPVAIVPGSPINIKITTRQDMKIAEQMLDLMPKPKLGPIHPFADDDKWR